MDVPPRLLEAFLHVARHGGVTPAARACGIERSTLSTHVNALERLCGLPLFERTPFRLNRHGRALFEVLQHCRHRVQAVIARIRRDAHPTLRLMAVEVITQAFLPQIAHAIEQRHPGLRCSVQSGSDHDMREQLCAGEIDAVVAPEHDGWHGLPRQRLITLPLALLAPAHSRFHDASELWALPKLTEVLYVPCASPALALAFDAGLTGLQMTWDNRREVSSSLSVRTAVANGLGYGLSLEVPELTQGLRVLPLTKFPRVPIAAFIVGRGQAAVRRTVMTLLRVAADAARQTR